jgi:hypothetical protein
MKSGYSHITFVLDNSGSMAHLKEQTIAGYNTFLKDQKAQPGNLTWSLYQFAKESVGYTQPAIKPVAVGGVAIGSALPLTPGNPGVVPVNYPPVGVGSANAVGGLLWNTTVTPSYHNVAKTYDFADVNVIPDLNDKNYLCETGTPLMDAIGVAINETGAKLAALPESERPEKVFFVILTDGQELHSRTYNRAQINEMITHQKNIYNWAFVFLAANQDAITVGASYGIAAQSSMTYDAAPDTMLRTYSTLSSSISASRGVVGAASVNFTQADREAVVKANDLR